MKLQFTKAMLMAVFLLVGNFGYANPPSSPTDGASNASTYPMFVSSPGSGESATVAPASGTVTRSGLNAVKFKIVNSCFGTNLRAISNPLAPTSIITATIVFSISGIVYSFQARYPAEVVTMDGLQTNKPMQASGMEKNNNDPNKSNYRVVRGDITAAGLVSDVQNSTAAIMGNIVLFNSNIIPSTAAVSADGTILAAEPGAIKILSYSFDQHITTCNGGPVYGSWGHSSYTPTYNCGSFMGHEGALYANVGGLKVSSDKTMMELHVSFPGQTGFCGGYWSPLMVFFDEGRPSFSNSSDFPINKYSGTAWPEANSPGWFVAIDDGTKTITKKEQLFGEGEKFKNGFEALKVSDSNHDGFIDKKDKDFKKLLLWRDLNGDGVSQAAEVVDLSSKITKISLKYSNDKLRPLGQNAEERQTSKFWYKDEKGKLKESTISDIWLAQMKAVKSTK